VHPETFEILPKGEAGLICVNGPSIFNGYLKIDNDPFIYIEKIKFYNTGDLGYFTNNNNLILSGRMKRFVKVAGEMISLPAMEEALSNKWPSNENGPTVALHAEEIPGSRPVITLFTTLDLTKELVMLEIKKAGFSNLAKISKVQNIETLPILGTGKTDYQTLKKLAS
jgi:long-chain-fatty-acid--[acyl-carrier-protein] ligase